MDPTARRIMKIDRDARRFLRHALSDTDLSLSEYDLIHTVRHHPGVSQEELRKMYHQDKSTIARRAARLESAGYIERRTDPGDARRKQLYPTPLAQRLKTTKASAESFFYGWLTEELTPEELKAFLPVLNSLYMKAKAERKAGFPLLLERYAAQRAAEAETCEKKP